MSIESRISGPFTEKENRGSQLGLEIGSKRFWKRVGLIAAGVSIGLVLLASIV